MFETCGQISKITYRPEIDGLRAIAVVAVVLFHANIGMPGGYVGVDVFFVISGYLITSLILRDIELGTFSIIGFWERRARRIFPASFVVSFSTLAAGWFLLLPSDYAALAHSALAQVFFVSNLYFWRSTNYFGGAAEGHPLLHTWSLAVEEQFYLLFPLVLLTLSFTSLHRRKFAFFNVLFVASLLGLLLSIYAVPKMPVAAFYLLPTRAWELLCGAAIAALPAGMSPHPKWASILSCVGLAGILVPCFVYTKETAFPGMSAIPPCLGAALFIWSSNSKISVLHSERLQVISRARIPCLLLSARPLVFIGLISYSLYLWHWPLFVLRAYWALEPISLVERIGLIIVAFLLAVISWHYVETPFRQRRLASSAVKMFAYSAGGFLGVALLASGIYVHNGVPARFSEQIVKCDEVRPNVATKRGLLKPVAFQDAIRGDFPRAGSTRPTSHAVFVWGDSHANAILPAVVAAAEQHDTAVFIAWHPSTPPVIGFKPSGRFSLGDKAPAYNDAVMQYIRVNKISKVLLVGAWNQYFSGNEDLAVLEQSILTTVQQLRESGCAVWILAEVPNHSIDVAQGLANSLLFGTNLTPYMCDRESLAEQAAEMDSLRPQLINAGAAIIDVSARLYDEELERFRIEEHGLPIYGDDDHLSEYGAQFVRDELQPLFQD